MNFVVENNVVVSCTEKKFSDLKIPDGVIAIADYVFQNCPNLTSVELPESCKKIGDYAFDGCNALKAVIGFKNIEIIGECAFSNCSSLSGVTFGEKISYLSNGAFLGCKKLKKLSLPQNINYVGCECFRDCIGLSEIEMQGVREIDNNAFENCSDICAVKLPESIAHIGQNAFSFCTNLKSVEFGNGFVVIDEKAFENTARLTFLYSNKNSTVYDFAIKNKFVFTQAIINPECRVIKAKQLSDVEKSGVFIQYKKHDNKGNIIIAFDRSERENVIKFLE